MDLQPQNFILSQAPDKALPNILFVLDWEEASYADPRFELLLLCRKVCADYQQARSLWGYYRQVIKNRYSLDIDGDAATDTAMMDSWLKLEGLHSVVTLLLQGTTAVLIHQKPQLDTTIPGRNPWERPIDIVRKLEREFSRLSFLGWKFCPCLTTLDNSTL